MNDTETTAMPPEPPGAARPQRTAWGSLSSPLADRLVAIFACLPFFAILGTVLSKGLLDIPTAVVFFQVALQIVTMLIRRHPERVTANPWFWLLAFVATYWPFLSAGMTHPGTPLVPSSVSSGVSLLSLGTAAWARLSLGRNIGFVPAQRQLVMRGAYAYVRHPIYTSIFISYLGYVLSDFSGLTVLRAFIGCFLFAIKSVAEERFLRTDPHYNDYMQKVRWRWLPGLA